MDAQLIVLVPGLEVVAVTERLLAQRFPTKTERTIPRAYDRLAVRHSPADLRLKVAQVLFAMVIPGTCRNETKAFVAVVYLSKELPLALCDRALYAIMYVTASSGSWKTGYRKSKRAIRNPHYTDLSSSCWQSSAGHAPLTGAMPGRHTTLRSCVHSE